MILGWLCRYRQLHIGPYRIHHGRVGVWLIIAGILACADDLLDWPWKCRL